MVSPTTGQMRLSGFSGGFPGELGAGPRYGHPRSCIWTRTKIIDSRLRVVHKCSTPHLNYIMCYLPYKPYIHGCRGVKRASYAYAYEFMWRAEVIESNGRHEVLQIHQPGSKCFLSNTQQSLSSVARMGESVTSVPRA